MYIRNENIKIFSCHFALPCHFAWTIVLWQWAACDNVTLHTDVILWMRKYTLIKILSVPHRSLQNSWIPILTRASLEIWQILSQLRVTLRASRVKQWAFRFTLRASRVTLWAFRVRLSFPCYIVCFTCYTTSISCYTASFPCHTASFPCYKANLACYTAIFPCYTASFSCHTATFPSLRKAPHSWASSSRNLLWLFICTQNL